MSCEEDTAPVMSNCVTDKLRALRVRGAVGVAGSEMIDRILFTWMNFLDINFLDRKPFVESDIHVNIIDEM